MNITHNRLGVPETPAERACTIWCRRGVIVPGFADEIAERRRIQHQWAGVDTTDDQHPQTVRGGASSTRGMEDSN